MEGEGGHDFIRCRKLHFDKCPVCNRKFKGIFSKRYYCRICKRSFHSSCKCHCSREFFCEESPYKPNRKGIDDVVFDDSTPTHHVPSPEVVPEVETHQQKPKHKKHKKSKKEKEPTLVKQLLDKYGEKEDDSDEIIIGPKGLVDFCTSLGFDILDIKGLILLWKANASNCGLLTRQELCTLVKQFNAEKEADIVKGLSDICTLIDKDIDELGKMYDYGFISCKDTPVSRTVESEMCAQMLEIVLANRPQFHHVESFIQFLNSGTKEKVNADEWHCIFTFCLKFGDDLSAYDDTSSWPCLIDEFVEYARNKSS